MDIGNPTQLHTCVTEPLGWLSQDGSAHRFLHIAQDNFYRNLTLEEQSNVGAFNFDHPTVSALTSCGSLSVHVSFTQAGIPIQHAFCGLSALVPVAGMLRDIFGTHTQALACAAACMRCSCGNAASSSVPSTRLHHENCWIVPAGFRVG